ncbi:hypothetical protein ACFOSC_00135 [Streptantibioticus rubrisoli]|uniref:Uncharacterized protein n=1 Tax=Streptantibioticus rubrisoli TaxID=1387313 RepID=A0ABT1PLF5_9ACTN|nr:hypothetical protein [Streptantibioticus rubrisoli]MCQ4045646.1 hypothetical protein [Streptantibioticus rubrisoli]
MINHTLFVQFTEPIPDSDLDQYVADVEKATKSTGSLLTFTAQRHIRVPGEEQIPAFIATVVIQLGLADLESLGTLFASPEVTEVFDTWRTRHPYKAAWANHETLA